MGLMILGEGAFHAEATGDEYHRQRVEEQRLWALNSLAMMPEYSGYGFYGTLSERACPSDGLVIERHPDGRPWAYWYTHHAWATAAILEGLLERSALRTRDVSAPWVAVPAGDALQSDTHR